jgi:hypothetical protein
MAAIKIIAPRGARPYVDGKHMLGDSDASDCYNCVFESGSVRGFYENENTADSASANTKTIYKYEPTGDFFYWETQTDIASVFRDQTDEKIIYTTDSFASVPKYTQGSMIGSGGTVATERTLGIPAPGGIPSTSKNGSETDEPSYDTRAYVYTWVDSALGWESAPSLSSSPITIDTAGQTVTVSGLGSAGPAGNYNVDKKRIYRTNTTDATTQYQFVDEINVTATSYVDSITAANLGEVLPTSDWDAPDEDMVGVVNHPAGFVCGFIKGSNKLCFSEPGYFYAWPIKYRIEVGYKIVGLTILGSALVVMTEGKTYMVSGSTPSSMLPREMPGSYPCISKRSIVEVGGEVCYASTDGLVGVSPSGLRLITKQLFTKNQWQDESPADMVGARWRGLYLASMNGAVWAIPTKNPEVGLTRRVMSFRAVTNDAATDDLYFVNASSTTIKQFASGNAKDSAAWLWTSKTFVFPTPVNFSVARIIGTGLTSGNIYLDEGEVKSTSSDDYAASIPLTQFQNGVPVRLPSGIKYKSLIVSFGESPDAEIQEIHLATSMRELPSG